MNLNATNERIKFKYFTYLEEAKQLGVHSVDTVAKAIARFETYTRHRDFKTFRQEQAIGFKKHFASQQNTRTGKKLSKATTYTTLNILKAFFFWLAGQPSYKKLQYTDSEFFNLSLKDTAVAKATREPRVPTPEEIRTALASMSSETTIDKRNHCLIAFTFLTGSRDDAIASMRLKHVDLIDGVVHHDARDMRTKFSKSFPTYFFEVGDDIRTIVEDWIAYLRSELGFGPDDPLFPQSRTGLKDDGTLGVVGLKRECWSNAAPIRAIFKQAFEGAGLRYFNPHSFRNTLVRLGMERCTSPEAFKAWSQNLGHDKVLTTYKSYGDIPAHKQRELIRAAVASSHDDRQALELGKLALAAIRERDSWGRKNQELL